MTVMQEVDAYTLAHPEFYERLLRYKASPEYLEELRKLLPPDWVLGRTDMWLHANAPGADLPMQGFKIHVSAIPEHTFPVLRAIVPELGRRGISFKVAGDSRLLSVLNSKLYGRGSSGKFMTIYPTDETCFRELIAALHEVTKDGGFCGPYILSDRRYGESQILFYRYGGIMPIERLRVDGMREGMLQAPDGSEIIDHRNPFFSLPAWVDDPFGGSKELVIDPSFRLGGRFTIESMLTASNRGGVYSGTDTVTGEAVIIKEARPHVNRAIYGSVVVDSFDLLRREYRNLQRLESRGRTPKALALVQEWEHLFLVQQKLGGRPLRNTMSEIDNLTLPYVNREGVLASFIPKLRTIGERLLELLDDVHSTGLLLGDLSMTNILVEEGWKFWLIDVESAVVPDEDGDFMLFAKEWATPGFTRADRSRRNSLILEDDYFAAGMVLYHCIVPTMGFFRLKPEAETEFLDELTAIGFPPGVREAIEALLAGDISACRDALATLPSLS